MSLNKTDSAKLQTLQDNVGLLIKIGNLSPESAFAGVAEKAAEFEAQTKHKVLLLGAPDKDGNWLTAVDLRRDILRLRQVGDGYTQLKARALGVSIDVKVARRDAYAHDNQRIADALEKLAASIRLQPSLVELGQGDLAYVPGEAVEVIEDDEAELASAGDASSVQQEAVATETTLEAQPAGETETETETQLQARTESQSLFAHRSNQAPY